MHAGARDTREAGTDDRGNVAGRRWQEWGSVQLSVGFDGEFFESRLRDLTPKPDFIYSNVTSTFYRKYTGPGRRV